MNGFRREVGILFANRCELDCLSMEESNLQDVSPIVGSYSDIYGMDGLVGRITLMS